VTSTTSRPPLAPTGKGRAMVARSIPRAAGSRRRHDVSVSKPPHSLSGVHSNMASANDMLLRTLRDPAKRDASCARWVIPAGANPGLQLDGPGAIMGRRPFTTAPGSTRMATRRIAADRGHMEKRSSIWCWRSRPRGKVTSA